MPQMRLSGPSDCRCRPFPALLAVVLAIALVACGKPPAPEKERPPAPKATSAHDGLRDAIDAPIDRVRGVEADVLEAADAQRAAIDTASGG